MKDSPVRGRQISMRQLLSRKSNQKMFDRLEGKKRDPPPIWPDDSFQPEIKSKSKQREDTDQQPKVSERSQYIPSASGPPKVTTTASTQGVIYRRCEDEPIHAPGTIQSFGALLGLKYNSHGHLQVRIASENSRSVLGYGVEQLFALPSFLDVLQHETRQEMIEHINYLFHGSDGLKDETQLDVFRMVIGFPYEPDIEVWCAMHVAPNAEGLLVCEFEKYSDTFYSKDILSAKKLPAMTPIQTSQDLSAEDFKKSTTSASKPLPVLEIARKRDDAHFSSLDIFKAMTQAQKQISACTTLSTVYDVVVGIIAELTNFHRVMFYRFDSDMNGCVESELLDPRASDDFFRGMHFPASDIPKQAQELYKINRIRLLHDRGAETARLVCRNRADFSQPLDLTHSYLRSISPVHCKYLANMEVRSTMSISIVINSKLWGLVACHGYGDTGTRVSLPIRELCRMIGESTASKIQQLLMAQRIEDRTTPIANMTPLNPGTFIASSSTDILKLVDADFAYLNSDENSQVIGMLDPYEEALAIISYLRSCRFTTVQSSHNIRKDFPGLTHAGLSVIGGLLLIPLNAKKGNPFLVFFRKSQLRQVRWAGNPYAKKLKAGTEYLQPRNSFKKWEETIAGTSKEWTEDQRDTASVLSTVYSKMIESWREKQTASDTSQIDLIRNSTHEFESPLNLLINSLEIASEDIVDERTRDILRHAYEASYSLIDKVENLLKITDAEIDATNGPNNFSGETFDLRVTATRALQVLQKEAKRNGFDFIMSVHDKLPAYVKGNGDNFRQLLDHLTQSAFKRSSAIQCNIILIRSQENHSTVLIQLKDSGPGMSESEVKITIEEFEHSQDDKDDCLPTMDKISSLDDTDGDSSVAITAIGQYVRSLHGKIQITSESTGTLLSLELPFEHSRPPPQMEDPRKLRNLFHPTSRPPRGAPVTSRSPPSLKNLKSINRSSIGPPSTNPFLLSESSKAGRRQSRALSSESSSPPLGSSRPSHRSSRLTPSTSPSPPLHATIPNHRSSQGTPSPTPSPPSESAKPARGESRRHTNPANNQAQAFWERSDSPSPPPDKALPPRPDQHQQDHGTAIPPTLGASPLSTVQESMGNNTETHSISKLGILIADDDPLSARNIDDRLSQWGHSVTVASDGQECHDRFEMHSDKTDIILMELKMPGVDGTLSTRMIRFLEKEQAQTKRYAASSSSHGSSNGSSKQRVPIFAVSSSLQEDKRFDYLQAGFDGWLLKPIDFRRLDVILQGVVDPKSRKDALYAPGEWDKGGWFLP